MNSVKTSLSIRGGGDSSDDSSASSDSEEEAKPKTVEEGQNTVSARKTARNFYAPEDIDECRLFAPCLHNGICYNGAGTYSCKCARGWTGKNCEIDVNECLQQPCQNDATCLNTKGS
ncbi:hypothetical protein DPMN_134857 [Dreissena polymorpha]|uniref:EGF-like domain-containing protein n=1 Tax=Dreissena polymorpha TaxID=45954 RepID=A0A9D4FZT1_DREPO|nr:hypothetical protein DPMN_134857 [Dreissena polymorpha]